MRRHLAILVAVGLVFIATTAGYVAFFSSHASGRSGTPTVRKQAGVRRAPRVVRSARPPQLATANPGEAFGEADFAPVGSSLKLEDRTTALLHSAFAVSTSERRGWSFRSSGGSPSAPGLGASGGGGSRGRSSSTPRIPSWLASRDGPAPTRVRRAPTSLGFGSSPLPEPAATLTFAASALVVSALLRKRQLGTS